MKIKLLLYLKKLVKSIFKDNIVIHKRIFFWIAVNFPKNLINKISILREARKILTSDIKIYMDKKEIKLLTTYLKKEDIMLEWGAGGSTLYFSKFVKQYYSIEHDFNWYYHVKQLAPSRVKLFYVPREHKFPTRKNQNQFYSYIKIIHDLGIKKFDKVLIDGRSRIQCAKEVLNYLDEKSLVFLHDFNARPQYNSILKDYDLVENLKSTKGLVILKPKKIAKNKD